MRKKVTTILAIYLAIICAVIIVTIVWEYELIPGIGPKPVTTTPPEGKTASRKACSVDSDCIIVDGDCCGCTMGGTATTVNKNFEKEWEDKLSGECKDIECIAVISDDPSCFEKPKCISNTCHLVEDETAD